MQFDQLRYFTALETASSFSQAAERTFVSQQGFGKAISALEKELGVRLAQRSPSGISLTPEGFIVLKHAQAMLRQQDEMYVELGNIQNTSTRLPWMGTPFIIQSLAVLWEERQTFSNLDLKEVSFDDGISQLVNGGSIPVLTAEIFPETRAQLESQGIFVDVFCHARMGLLHKGTQPLKDSARCAIEDASSLPLIVFTGKTMERMLKTLFAERTKDRIEKTSSYINIANAVISEDAYGLIDSYSFVGLARDPKWCSHDLRFTPIDSANAFFYVAWLYPKSRPLPPRYRASINHSRGLFSSVPVPTENRIQT